jgi:hypothetical protein
MAGMVLDAETAVSLSSLRQVLSRLESYEAFCAFMQSSGAQDLVAFYVKVELYKDKALRALQMARRVKRMSQLARPEADIHDEFGALNDSVDTSDGVDGSYSANGTQLDQNGADANANDNNHDDDHENGTEKDHDSQGDFDPHGAFYIAVEIFTEFMQVQDGSKAFKRRRSSAHDEYGDNLDDNDNDGDDNLNSGFRAKKSHKQAGEDIHDDIDDTDDEMDDDDDNDDNDDDGGSDDDEGSFDDVHADDDLFQGKSGLKLPMNITAHHKAAQRRDLRRMERLLDKQQARYKAKLSRYHALGLGSRFGISSLDKHSGNQTRSEPLDLSSTLLPLSLPLSKLLPKRCTVAIADSLSKYFDNRMQSQPVDHNSANSRPDTHSRSHSFAHSYYSYHHSYRTQPSLPDLGSDTMTRFDISANSANSTKRANDLQRDVPRSLNAQHDFLLDSPFNSQSHSQSHSQTNKQPGNYDAQMSVSLNVLAFNGNTQTMNNNSNNIMNNRKSPVHGTNKSNNISNNKSSIIVGHSASLSPASSRGSSRGGGGGEFSFSNEDLRRSNSSNKSYNNNSFSSVATTPTVAGVSSGAYSSGKGNNNNNSHNNHNSIKSGSRAGSIGGNEDMMTLRGFTASGHSSLKSTRSKNTITSITSITSVNSNLSNSSNNNFNRSSEDETPSSPSVHSIHSRFGQGDTLVSSLTMIGPDPNLGLMYREGLDLQINADSSLQELKAGLANLNAAYDDEICALEKFYDERRAHIENIIRQKMLAPQ